MEQKKSSSTINDWEEVPIDDWQEIPVGGQQQSPQMRLGNEPTVPTFRVPTYVAPPQTSTDFFNRGMPASGTIQAARNVMALPGQAIEAERNFANNLIPSSGDVLTAPVRAAGWLLGQGGNLLNQGTDWFTKQNFGTTFDEIANAVRDTPMGSVLNQANELRKELAPVAVGAGLALAGPPVIRGTGRAIETGASRMASSAFKAGESIPRIKQLGQFAQERGITLTEGKLNALKEVNDHLNTELNTKVIDPATRNKTPISGKAVLDALDSAKQQFASGPFGDEAASRMIDRLKTSFSRNLDGYGNITPRQAQDYKVYLNRELSKFYDAMEKGQDPLLLKKKAIISEANTALRKQIEDIHPEVKGLNWEEGAGLELTKEMEKFVKEKLKGNSGAALVMRARPGFLPSISVYDLLGTRTFRSKLAPMLGKVGRAMSGRVPNIVTGIRNPIAPNRPPVGLLPPVPFQMGGPTESTFNITPGQVVQPTWADMPNRLLPPRRSGPVVEGSSTQPIPLRDFGTPEPSNPWAMRSGPELSPQDRMVVTKKVSYQGMYRDGREEYIIVDPGSPAYGSNITLRPGENLLRRIKDKEDSFLGKTMPRRTSQIGRASTGQR